MRLNSANINVMVKACSKASKVLIRDFGEIEKLQVALKGPGDFVTASDKKVEKILIDELQKARPNYSILSEETGEINNNKDEKFRWIIDPIDGTINFLHGVPHFAISVALEHKGEIISGIVYDPIKNELFSGEKGNGSYLNNQRMRVSGRTKLEDCIIFTGGPKFKSEDQEKSFEEYIKISGTDSQRFLAWKSRIVYRCIRIGFVASYPSRSVMLPNSRAMAVVKILNVEPISYTP